MTAAKTFASLEKEVSIAARTCQDRLVLLRLLFVFFAYVDDLMNVLIGIQRCLAQGDVRAVDHEVRSETLNFFGPGGTEHGCLTIRLERGGNKWQCDDDMLDRASRKEYILECT